MEPTTMKSARLEERHAQENVVRASTSAPHIRRAYGELLGNDYEHLFYQHVQLTAAAQTFATRFEIAMDWAREVVLNAIGMHLRRPFQPMLITNAQSAFLDPSSFYSSDARMKIAAFVSAVGADFAVVSLGGGYDGRRESFAIVGTDGLTVREIQIAATYERAGLPSVDVRSDEQMAPWENDFLGDAARAIREREVSRPSAA